MSYLTCITLESCNSALREYFSRSYRQMKEQKKLYLVTYKLYRIRRELVATRLRKLTVFMSFACFTLKSDIFAQRVCFFRFVTLKERADNFLSIGI